MTAPLLTLREVADHLRVTPRTVQTLIKRDELPVVRFGHSVRVDPQALEQWIEKRTNREGGAA